MIHHCLHFSMKILFSPVGSTDPVRGYHDGAMLHILRHYDVDKVIIFMTAEMSEREDTQHIYSRGIESLGKALKIELVKSNITEPQQYDELVGLQEAFAKSYQDNPEADWLINISSGTPQMKTIMTLVAIDFPRCTAVQVYSPEKKSNVSNNPNDDDDMLAMLDANEDAEPNAPNRCHPQHLRILRRYGIRLEIESLLHNYEYEGAYRLCMDNADMFSDDTQRLLEHAALRANLQWKEANRVIASYHGERLIRYGTDFAQYFLVTEMRQRKKQLPEFIVKVSSILVTLALKYLRSLKKEYDVDKFIKNDDGKNSISIPKMDKYDKDLGIYLDEKYVGGFRGGIIYFQTLIHIIKYLERKGKVKGQQKIKIIDSFDKLRSIEEKSRNSVAHEITNLTEQDLMTPSNKGIPGMNSKSIILELHHIIRILYGSDIEWDYDRLNELIIDSMREV